MSNFSPQQIYAVGSQVVLQVDLLVQGGGAKKKAGSVGVITCKTALE